MRPGIQRGLLQRAQASPERTGKTFPSVRRGLKPWSYGTSSTIYGPESTIVKLGSRTLRAAPLAVMS